MKKSVTFSIPAGMEKGTRAASKPLPSLAFLMHEVRRNLVARSKMDRSFSRGIALKFSWLLVVICLLATETYAIDEDSIKIYSGKEPFRITKAKSPITVDGTVDEGAWEKALKLELKYEVRPGENVKPPVETEVLFTFSETNLYVAFRAFDPRPAEIRARYSDRDNAWSDDWVGIVLDTFNDERRAYEFISNPLGVQNDAINDEAGGSYTESWNAIWNSAGRITEDGYEVEMAIPFSQLRFQPAEGEQTWGLDAIRSYPRSDRHHIGLFPRDRGANSYLSQGEKMVGFSGVKQGKNLEIVPTLVSSRSDERMDFPNGDLSNGDPNSDLGLSVRWGATPNLTLNGTVNPDFSQVEADSVQLDINETFALFFPETRPFFLDGADYFNTRLNLVHTRTIADPKGALKLTGKSGKHTYGIFSAQDKVTNVLVPGAEGSGGDSFQFENTSSVARYRYDFGRNSTVGAMVTDREGSQYYNRIYSVDTRYRITDSDTINFNGVYSQTRYNTQIAEEFEEDVVPGEDISDHGIYFSYNRSKRNYWLSTSYNDFGKDFRSDLGFIPQVNYRKLVAGAGRIWQGRKDTYYNRMELGGDWDQTETQNGDLLEREYESWFSLDGPRESELYTSLGFRTRVFEGKSFDQFYQYFWYGWRPSGKVWLGMEVSSGDWIDFTHAREATRLNLSPEISLSLGRHLKSSLVYRYRKLDVDEGNLFTAQIPEMRVVYQHNVRTFVRAIFQYTQIDRTVDLYEDDDVDPRSEDLLAQLLFSYKLNPQTVAYVGYTDSYGGNDEFDLLQRERAFFIKIGYAWLK